MKGDGGKGKNGGGKGKKGDGASRLPKDQCRKCGASGHWGNECPNDQGGGRVVMGAVVGQRATALAPQPVITTPVVQAQPVAAPQITLDQVKGLVAAYAK